MSQFSWSFYSCFFGSPFSLYIIISLGYFMVEFLWLLVPVKWLVSWWFSWYFHCERFSRNVPHLIRFWFPGRFHLQQAGNFLFWLLSISRASFGQIYVGAFHFNPSVSFANIRMEIFIVAFTAIFNKYITASFVKHFNALLFNPSCALASNLSLYILFSIL